MPRLMFDRQVLAPPGYAERGCLLVKYRLPWLRHCFIVCHEPRQGAPVLAPAELMAFAIEQAGQLADALTGDAEAFILIHSGAAVRKRANWHLHIFVVRHRWQKMWVYSVLGAKNLGLALYSSVRSLAARAAVKAPPTSAQTDPARVRMILKELHNG
jgi:hypothetical protein